MPLKLTQDDTPGPNLTPMIDVVFLLVVFFMVATEFTEREQDLQLALPEVPAAGAAASQPSSPLQVAVFVDGRIELDGQPVTTPELTRRLQAATAESADVEVVINGDKNCPFQHVAAALAACREARVSEVSVPVEIAGAATGGGLR
ncbi:MAG: biopolymer transporter ExbD [Planctomycetota bacterium]